MSAISFDDIETMSEKLDRANEEIARLRAENERLQKTIAAGKFLAADLMTEYKTLWSAVVEFMNTPGTLTEVEEEAYNDVVNCVYRSRFWIGSPQVQGKS